MNSENKLSKKRDQPEEETKNPICSICTDELKPETPKGEIECGHAFCIDCIQKWAAIETTCPYCKREFSKIIVKEKVKKAKPIYKRRLRRNTTKVSNVSK